ncbi:ATP-binding cassette domain-containing protein, partial [Candidatus Dojkabacteria bacterium]|nr:ATP-binding cassette domain-containing protein [Candidatus Dojkabacteria bacterium]
NDTIAFNIAYGRPDAKMAEIKRVAKLANMSDFVEKLPKGYESIVGERGIKLSGGQKQRLAIARVILEDPEIIIFDEATSQLDSANEIKIQDAFKNLCRGKTTIIIAHRLSTVVDADKIIVFSNGQIAQIGDHTHLAEMDGIYRDLWRLQTERI